MYGSFHDSMPFMRRLIERWDVCVMCAAVVVFAEGADSGMVSNECGK